MDIEDEFKTFEDNFELVTMGMVINGVYPNKTLRTYSRIIILPLILYLCLALYSCRVALNQGDFREFAKQMPILLTSEISFVKLIVFHFKHDKIVKLISDINNSYKRAKYQPEWEREYIKEGIDKGKKRPLIWLVLGVSGIFAVWAVPLIQSSKVDLENNYRQKIVIHDLTLPLMNEYKSEFPLFELLYMYTLLSFSFIVVSYLAVDGFFFVVATHTEMQLKIVKTKVLNLFSNLQDPKAFLLKFRIKNIACHYLEIERFHKEVQDVMSVIFANIFFFTSIHLCVSAYQTVEFMKAKDLVLGDITIVLGSTLQAYVLCSYGSIISEMSESLGEAAYFSNWYENMDSSSMRSINILMMRFQKPLTYNAFRIIPLNIESFSSMLTTAWSLFNLLRSQL